MSQIAETLGCHVESFGYETGWYVDLPSHGKTFMTRLHTEMPDEVFLAPRCGLWRRMQAINATTPEKKEHLQQQRDEHHRHHLKFVKEIYISQVHGGRQAHIEQPHGALSWLTAAFKNLPGLYAIFDQCCYGACCLDSDGIWKPVQKTTGILTTKKSLAAALCLRCDKSHTADWYRKPNQVAASSTKRVLRFNESLQADVFWLRNGDNKFPILSVIDKGTKFQKAHLVSSEKSQDYIDALDKGWINHFGPPSRLLTDAGRGWLSSELAEWTDAHCIQHVVAAGEAHEQLALVERRHAVLRKALEVFLTDYGINGAKAIMQALRYVIPQMNNSPSTSGFSPAQWVPGQSPDFPGELLGTSLTPVHLADSFEHELARRATAKMAIIQADTDMKLRRALLRKYAGTNISLMPGQKCFFWRDAVT